METKETTLKDINEILKKQEISINQIERNLHWQKELIDDIERNTRTTKNCIRLITSLTIIKLILILAIAYYIANTTINIFH